MKIITRFHVVLEKEEEGGFSVYVPALPGGRNFSFLSKFPQLPGELRARLTVEEFNGLL